MRRFIENLVRLRSQNCTTLFTTLTVILIHHGWTPLFVAAWAGKDDVVGVLLRAAANPTAETTSEHLGIPAGSTPISVAQVQGHVEVVRLLEA